MVFKSSPWWALFGLLAIGLVLAAIASMGIYVKSKSPVVLEVPAGENDQKPETPKNVSTRDIEAGRDQITSARDIVIDNSIQNVEANNVEVHFDTPELAIKSYPRTIETDVGIKEVEVWILWRDASWRFAQVSFNKPKLNEFLSSSKYRAALNNADAIVCVGLSSSWVDKGRTTPVSSLSLERQLEIEEKTDNRAFTLCKTLSEHSSKVARKPQFIGVGLGYHVDKAPNDEADKRQRALVMLHVKNGGSNISMNDAEQLLADVLNDPTIEEFEGDRYSRIANEGSVCWSMTVHGTFNAEDLDC